MLVLTRKREEKITIGNNPQIVITILKIQGDKVSIGIEADRDTPIYRNELLKGKSSLQSEQTEMQLQHLQIDLNNTETLSEVNQLGL